MTEARPSRSKAWVQLFKLAAGLAMIAWLGYYLVRHRQQLSELFQASPGTLLATAVAVAATWLLMSAQGYLLLRALDVRIGFIEHTELQFASILANYLPIRLGPVLKMHYLKRVHDVPLAHFGSLLIVRAVLLIATCGLVGLGGVLALHFRGEAVAIELFALFGMLILGPAILGLLPLRALKMDRWRPLARFVNGIEQVREKRGLLAWLVLLLTFQLSVVALRLHWTFGAVSTEMSAPIVFTVAAVAALVNLLAFTMGSLGVREAAIGWATEAVGFDFSRGVFAGLVDRAVLITLAYLLGIWGLFATRRRLRSVDSSEISP